jgi:glycosyltransferase involved in cell wall biosynthesis
LILAASSPKRIAIVCATRNAAATLASMLDSYLAERTAETELVIVDSCSTDNTPAILSRYESCIDRLIVESDRSIYEAWNKGVAASSADYVCFIGADDRLASGVVKTLLQLIEDYPTADYIHGCNVMCRNGRPVGIIGREYDDSTIEKYMPMAHVMSAHRRNWLLDHGGFDESYKSSGDYDYFLRVRHNIRIKWNYTIFAYVEDAGISRGSMLPLRESHAARCRNGVKYWKSLYWFCRGVISMQMRKVLGI